MAGDTLNQNLTDPLKTSVKTPSVGESLATLKDLTERGIKSEQEIGRLQAEKIEKEPEIKAGLLEAQKAYRGAQDEIQQAKIRSAEEDMSKFTVSQDSIAGMSALGTAILMMGNLLGRSGGQQSAMGAIQGMTGMMQGYNSGRKDLYEQHNKRKRVRR